MTVASNPKAWGRCFILVVVLAILCATDAGRTIQVDNTKEYVLNVGGEELRFVTRPELGYVVKARQDAASIEALDGILKSVGVGNVSPIRGLGRKGVAVVYSERSAEENEKTIKSLMARDEVQYVAPLFSSNGETVAIIPEIVIRVKPDMEIDQVQAICEAAGCTIIKRMEFTEQEYLIEILGMDAEAVLTAVEQLNEIPLVEWACPNAACQPKVPNRPIPETRKFGGYQLFGEPEQDANTPGVFPNDEYFPRQWHLHNTGQSGGTPGADIRATEAWEITTGDPNIIIAVLDSGVDLHHPDLVDNLVPGYNFVDNDDQPEPELDRGNAHGTACAGLVGAQGNNEIGVSGVTWNCTLMPIRIHGINADGAFYMITSADLAKAIRWAATHGADILSNSWGQLTETEIIHSAVKDITKIGGMGREGKGCIAVWAADIQGRRIPSADQAAYSEVIAVGATDHNDVRLGYSDYGPELDISGPNGELGSYISNIWTTDISGAAGFNNRNHDILDYTDGMAGTSASCPIVAGVAALILSLNPNLTNVEVQRILYRSAQDLGEPGWDQYYGWGRVDARAAVEMALNPPPLLLHYVDNDAPGDPGPGDREVSDPNEDGSAEHPFDTIQEAINNAIPGETVIVLPGAYIGDGNRDISFLSRAITVRSLDPNDSQVVAATVIDCQGTQTERHQGFLFNNGESSQSVLAGLTITNAYGVYGGGILCTANSSPTIRQCLLRVNRATQRGGGIYITSGSPLVTNCIFSGNTAPNGGALYNLSNAQVINCTFTENSATTGGGTHNQGGTLTLTNCILWNNTPAEIRVGAGKVSITYSDIQGGWEGEGNRDVIPLFADAANGDYHLKSQAGRWDPVSESWVIDDLTSPCIDAGDPSCPVGDEPEPNGGRINMGAYGGTAEASMSLIVQ